MKTRIGIFYLLFFLLIPATMAQERYRVLTHETEAKDNISILFVSGKACDIAVHFALYTHPSNVKKAKTQHYYFQKDHYGQGIWDGFQKITVSETKLSLELNPAARKSFNSQVIDIQLDEWQKEYTYADFKFHLQKMFRGIEQVLFFEEDYKFIKHLIIDFEHAGLPTAELKTELRTIIQKFEQTHHLTIHYNNKIYGALGGGEMFKIDMENLENSPKEALISQVKQAFSDKIQVIISYE